MAAEREIELKLEVSPDALERMKQAVPAPGFQQGEEQLHKLNSLYFDTPDQALRKRKISIRVREKAPGTYVQTLKLGTGVSGGLSKAIEIERPVADRGLDLAAIDEPKALAVLIDAIAGQPLLPVFETVIDRTTRILRSDDGAVIEVAFDSGQVIAGPDQVDLAELELELMSGSAESLFSAAQWIANGNPFRFSPHNKAERGFRLAEGASDAIRPAFAAHARLRPDQTTESVFETILTGCLTQIADNRLAVLTGTDPEGPHQLRVGLRRLRSAFRLFKPLLSDDPWAAGLSDEARDLATAVGGLRDLDVLQEEIVEPMVPLLPGSVTARPLIEALTAKREATRQALTGELQQSHWNRFLLALTAYISLRGWQEQDAEKLARKWALPIEMYADTALAKQWKKVCTHGDRLDELTIPERHEMRKALKKMRYGLEFFASLYPENRRKPYLKHLKKLQNVFGFLNDVAMAERLLDHLGNLPEDGVFTVGFCLGHNRARADLEWTRARALWQSLAEIRPVWKP